MSWRFRKKVKIFPGIYLNLSTTGISTTIGQKGLSINLGGNGAYLNTGIPGTGLYNRIPLSGLGNKQVNPEDASNIAERLQYLLEQTYDSSEQIKSETIGQLTSSGLSSLKQTIIAAHKEHSEIESLITDKTSIKEVSDKKLKKLRTSILKFLFKKKIEALSLSVQNLDEELKELQEQLNLSKVELNINNDSVFEEIYHRVELASQLLVTCNKIWDITTTKEINRFQQRSYASSEVNRVEAKALIENSDLISTSKSPLRLHNKNGGDLYFFPGFIIIHEQLLDFAILDYSELTIEFIPTKFVETETLPSDTEVIEYTWAKVNKDGSQDKRFKDNYQIPVTKYGQINLISKTGLKEAFLFSNNKYASLFAEALANYISVVKSSTALLNEFQ